MKKKIVKMSFVFLSLPIFSLAAYAAIPQASIAAPSEANICSATRVITTTVVNTPTSVRFEIKTMIADTWTVLGSSGGVAGSFKWSLDTSQLSNDSVYELRAVATNADGTDASPASTWVKVYRNPIVTGLNTISLDGSTPPVDSGKSYVKAGTLLIKTNAFKNCESANIVMDTNTLPTASITTANGTILSPTQQGWVVSGGQYIFITTFTITSASVNGNAIFNISGGVTPAPVYAMQTYINSAFVIDTTQPQIVSVLVDENGDTSFADNNGFVAVAERPKIYITFSEKMNVNESVLISSYTPQNRTSVGITGANLEDWVAGSNQTIYTIRMPAAISNTTGDGPCGFYLNNGFFDIAGTTIPVYVNPSLFVIDGTAPKAPVISTPIAGAQVEAGTNLPVTVQSPTDTDISLLWVTDGINNYLDYTAPYKIDIPLTSAFAGTITAWFQDKAGNFSNGSAVTVAVTQPKDTTAPRARGTGIAALGTQTYTLTASVNEANANVEKIVFQYSTDNVNWVTISTDSVNTDGFTCTWDVSALNSGTYYLRVIATDLTGNTDASPVVNTVALSKEAPSLTNTGSTVSADTTNDIQAAAALNTANSSISISVNSQDTPSVSVFLTNTVTNKTEWLPSSDLTRSGSAGAWAFTATNSFITTNVMATIYIKIIDTNGQLITKQFNIGNDTVDYTQNYVTPIPAIGAYVSIPAFSLQSNKVLAINSTQLAASTGQQGLIPLGPLYDFSFADGTNQFQPVTIRFYYPSLAATNNIFPGSSVEKTKLTVCYLKDNKWTRDKNIAVNAAGDISTQFTTTHFSKFALVADYSNPAISDIKEAGLVITAKVSDTGSGISTAGSFLKINGANAAITYNETTGNITFGLTGVGITDRGNYEYTIHLQDNVGNFTEVTRTLKFSQQAELQDAHNYPNPFNPDKEDTTITFMLSEPSLVTVKVFDFNGKLVSAIKKDEQNPVAYGPGVVTFKWGGTNDNGERVANGTYFCEIVINGSQNNIGRTSRQIIKIAAVR